MLNTDTNFYGQQEDERILYVVRPHALAFILKLLKVYLVALFVFISFIAIGSLLPDIKSIFSFLAIILGLIIMAVGSKLVNDQQKKNLAYLTDRRIVRFEPTTFFATNIRTLSWDEVVKVKTYSPNMIWKQLAVGTVVVHARSTLRVDEPKADTVTVDDIEMDDVYLYRDLGNYVDKILFTYKAHARGLGFASSAYKRRPKEVAEIHPFVPKPKGQRY